MQNQAPVSSDEKLREGGVLELGYEDWKRDKVMRALAQSRDPSSLISAEQVWRDLGLET